MYDQVDSPVALMPQPTPLANTAPSAKDRPEPMEPVKRQVAKWQDRIRSAKKKRDADFERMREDMEFVGGIQWPEQDNLADEDRYIANITIREVNQKVAVLYARNPKAVAQRRERMEYTVWDEKQETLERAAMAVAQGAMSGQIDPMAGAVIQDEIAGQQRKDLMDKLAKTLEVEYQIQIDRQEPEFKLQMKQLVRRVCVCGVGYVKASFARQDRVDLHATDTNEPLSETSKRIMGLLQDYEDKVIDEDDSRIEELRMLVRSLNYRLSDPATASQVDERLIFDFPSATSIIVDPACRILKGLVGARWLAQEYILPVDEVRALFERPDISTGSGEVKQYKPSGQELPPHTSSNDTPSEDETCVAVWEVFDKTTRARFFLCDGYDDYLLEPEEPQPCIQRFWTIMPLTFNDTETEPGLRVTIYPPSDVRLMRSMQREWNRSQEGLRKHRNANRPKYLTATGTLTDEDKKRLNSYPDNAVIELLGGVPPGTDVQKLVAPFLSVPIDPALYGKEPLKEDIQMTVGAQPEVMGAPSSETATGSTIQEQARLSSVSSNVDDLDDLLTEMARVGGEMMVREMSVETVKRDCGQGAVWPATQEARADAISRISLEVQAASTGRPNQGLRIAHIRDIAPLLMAAGANPKFVVEEVIKAYDERISVQRAFPLMQPMPSPQGGMATSNRTQAGPPMPVAAPNDASSSNVPNPAHSPLSHGQPLQQQSP